ncbi:MAG: SH3 domain-containing protein [Candidatus Odinarchaeota archaeon]
MKGRKCRVIKKYESPYTVPLLITKGEILSIDEKESEWSGWIWCTNKKGLSRWVPESYLEVKDNIGKVKQDYNATELSVNVGEELFIEEEEAEWYWVTNQQGKSGWVPIKNVKIIKEK